MGASPLRGDRAIRSNKNAVVPRPILMGLALEFGAPPQTPKIKTRKRFYSAPIPCAFAGRKNRAPKPAEFRFFDSFSCFFAFFNAFSSRPFFCLPLLKKFRGFFQRAHSFEESFS
jgi:hypothetical protein